MSDDPRTLPVIQPGAQAGAPPVFEKIAILGLGLIGGARCTRIGEGLLGVPAVGTGGIVLTHVDRRRLAAGIALSVGDLDLVEEVISFEPPWRRVYELSGAPVALYQGTTAFVDRGDSCLMSWSLLVDPLPGSASDAFMAAAEKFLTGFADRLKEMVESGG